MKKNEGLSVPNGVSPFERIRRTNASGAEYWPSREFAQVLGYSDYRNFEHVIKKAKTACFNSGQSIEDHFVDITEMVEIGKGGQMRKRTSPSPAFPLLGIQTPAYNTVVARVERNGFGGREMTSKYVLTPLTFPQWRRVRGIAQILCLTKMAGTVGVRLPQEVPCSSSI